MAGSGATYAIADLPDSVSAAALVAAATKTGAFKDVKVHEVLNKDQIREMVVLAKDTADAYRPPGQAAIDRDIQHAEGQTTGFDRPPPTSSTATSSDWLTRAVVLQVGGERSRRELNGKRRRWLGEVRRLTPG